MTARTSQLLADALRSAGMIDLARRAEADEFHDFLSPHALPDLELDGELLKVMRLSEDERLKIAATNIRSRHHNGDFDADKAESDAWAESEDGRDAFNRLVEGD